VVPHIGIGSVLREVSQLGTGTQNPKIAVSDELLKKVLVTVVAILGLAVWGMLGHAERTDDCLSNCVTDFSANRR
jgi:hypothetical protein